jgi:aspartyl-tRNA synthetase
MLQKEVTLCGWVSTVRSVSTNLFFLLLRDHSGVIQLTLTRTHIAEDVFLNLQAAVESKLITKEAVLAVRGIVQPRPIGMTNDSMASGAIEIFVNSFKILNTVSKKLPFTPNGKCLPSEDLRLQNRFLDLRRSEMQENIRFRAKVNQNLRSFFNFHGII